MIMINKAAMYIFLYLTITPIIKPFNGVSNGVSHVLMKLFD